MEPFTVHTAGQPGNDHLQRCVPCGVVLTDNTAWAEGRVAVMDGDDTGPPWWPVGALVATDKIPGRASMTYTVEGGRPLAADEAACT